MKKGTRDPKGTGKVKTRRVRIGDLNARADRAVKGGGLQEAAAAAAGAMSGQGSSAALQAQMQAASQQAALQHALHLSLVKKSGKGGV